MLKSLPSIDQVLGYPELSELAAKRPRELLLLLARLAVDGLRRELAAGAALPTGPDGKLPAALVAGRVRAEEQKLLAPSLRRVVNATGVVIHTNLGRAPLDPGLMDAMTAVLGGYSNLEFDLETGERGSRHARLARLIRAVTGAEDGFVVNNNAAAVLVALNTLAAGKEVVVSRGELIEIGGSFRLPDIIERGGARLREVGATNKTRLADYERAIGPDTALLLKVHPSNFRIVGFFEEVEIRELVELGRRHNLPVMFDLGSGLLADLSAYGIVAEKPVRSYLESGADIVTFSGDKLLGGPQAGFIVGKQGLVEGIKKNPMVRALRVGKLTIAALEALLASYLSDDDPRRRVPALRLLTRPADEIEAQAQALAAAIRARRPEAETAVEADEAFAGGGALPVSPLPTFVVTVTVPGLAPAVLAAALRRAETPVVGRLRAGRFCLDCRTLLPGDSDLILDAFARLAR
jgi:L-seryl-tRNA(Ser) seleniumtransferase